MFTTDVVDGVLRLRGPGSRWLATGWDGGYVDADAAYNVTVPEGFERTDLDAYARERRGDAGFEHDGPTLLTGVAMRHARGTRSGPVTCVATAGVSNPAALPMADERSPGSAGGRLSDPRRPGTVNVVLGVECALDDGTLATLLATAVEAKTATLLHRTGFTGTTTDAVVVGTDPDGAPTAFAGSGTALGAHARACVRDAVAASLDARYADTPPPASVEEAEYGTTSAPRSTVFDPTG